MVNKKKNILHIQYDIAKVYNEEEGAHLNMMLFNVNDLYLNCVLTKFINLLIYQFIYLGF